MDKKKRFLPARSAHAYLSAMTTIGYVKIETAAEEFIFELPLADFDRLGREIRAARLSSRDTPSPRDDR